MSSPEGATDGCVLDADAVVPFSRELVSLLDAACATTSARLRAPVNVRLLDADGELRTIAMRAPDPAVADDIRRTIDRTAVPSAVVEAFVTGEPVRTAGLHPFGTSATLQAMTARQCITGLFVAPLVVQGHTIGTMAAAHSGEQELDDEDLAILTAAAEELARRIDEQQLLDIVRQQLGERSLAERRQTALMRHTSDAVFVVSRAGKILDVTSSVTGMLGWEPETVIGMNLLELVDPEELDRVVAAFADVIAIDGPTGVAELAVRHDDGTKRWLECTGNNLLEDPAVAAYVVTARDVTERHNAAELLATENGILFQIAERAPVDRTLEAIARFVETSIDVMVTMILNIERGGVVRVAAAPSLPKPMLRTLDGWQLNESCLADMLAPAAGMLVSDTATGGQWAGSRAAAQAAGIKCSWSHQTRDQSGQVIGCITSFVAESREPSDYEQHVIQLASHLAGMALAQHRSERAMAYAATHDPLTSLPNRTLFLDRLERVLTRAGDGHGVAVVFVDLDDFKAVNDTSGHAVGDRLLCEVASRLAEVVRPTDLIARLGGDEFAILCDGDSAAGARAVADSVLQALDMPFVVDGQVFHVSASAGIAVGGGPSSTPDNVLRDADTAMYEAKRMGRGRYAVFTPAVRDTAVRRRTLAQDLRKAIELDALDVHYQPVVELATGRILGLEALARWNSPIHGDVPPNEFIDIAESAGLIACLGAVILRKAVERAAAWRVSGLLDPDATIAVNVSARQLADPTFVPTVIDTLASFGFPAAALCIEITESAVMSDLDGSQEALARLTELGITIAIDDFGTGHSSLSRLRTLDAAVLKLDRSFILDLDSDPDSVDFVAGVVHLAHALGKQLVVEGVERSSQQHVLLELGADAAQGFHLARPQAADAIEGLLRVTPNWAS